MHVFSAANGALLEVAAGSVTADRPELILDPLVLRGIGAQFSVVMETPFGALLSPVPVSV